MRLDFDTFTILGPTDSLVNFPVVVGANAETLGGSCLDVFRVTVSSSYQYMSWLIQFLYEDFLNSIKLLPLCPIDLRKKIKF